MNMRHPLILQSTKIKNSAGVIAALLLSLTRMQAEVRFLGHGHTDLAVDYDASTSQWNFHVGSDALGAEFAPDEVVLKVKPAARTTVPANPTFAFLGTSGSPVWILPQAEKEPLLYLGYGGEGIPDGVFVGNQVKVTLKSVTGPGSFFSYLVNGLGNPQVLFNSADGISANDVATVTGGADAHLAWAFTQAGDYKIVLEASGTLVAGNKVTSSGPVTFTFSVGGGPKLLDTGHTDLAVDYSADEDAWDVHVGSDVLEETYDADDVILKVKGEAKTTIPANPKFSFLGTAGSPIWILTQAENDRFLFLGYGGDGIPEGIFTGNQVKIALKSVSGPGDFFSYTVDGFGNPVVDFNTRDGITAADVATLQGGGDAHLNWGFTRAGDYAVTVEVSGTLVAGNKVVSSGSITYNFSVEGVLVDEHTDVQVLYDSSRGTNALSIIARDVTHNADYPTNKVLFVVSEAAKLTLPAGTPFGKEGTPLWALTQSQIPNILYLGLSAEGIPSGVFSGGALTLRLKSVDGPGQFFLWQASQFGGFDVKMNSADGITDADFHTQQIGSHEHFNWGFTATGVYYVTWQVSGQRVGETARISSLEATFRFDVLPLPTNAPPVKIQLSDARFLTGGNFTFNVIGAQNLAIEIHATDNLTQWSTVTNLVPTVSPQPITIPGNSAKPFRFFRVLQK
jgi:surface-anchored protein